MEQLIDLLPTIVTIAIAAGLGWLLIFRPASALLPPLFAALMDRLSQAKPGWEKYRGLITDGVRFAEKAIPDDATNKSAARFDAALKRSLELLDADHGITAPGDGLLAIIKEGIRVIHGEQPAPAAVPPMWERYADILTEAVQAAEKAKIQPGNSATQKLTFAVQYALDQIKADYGELAANVPGLDVSLKQGARRVHAEAKAAGIIAH